MPDCVLAAITVVLVFQTTPLADDRPVWTIQTRWFSDFGRRGLRHMQLSTSAGRDAAWLSRRMTTAMVPFFTKDCFDSNAVWVRIRDWGSLMCLAPNLSPHSLFVQLYFSQVQTCSGWYLSAMENPYALHSLPQKSL